MEIRKAVDSDLDNIMTFIGSYWKRGHVLSESKLFMEWQHKSEEGFNFINWKDRCNDLFITEDNITKKKPNKISLENLKKALKFLRQ